MKTIMLYLVTFLTFFSVSSLTLEEDDFRKAIHEGYQKYTYYIEQNDTLGDLVIVLGKTNDKNSFSLFYYQNSEEDVTINININDGKKKITARSQNKIICVYNVSLESLTSKSITINFKFKNSESVFKKLVIDKADVENTVSLPLTTGEGKNKFPTSTVYSSPFYKYLIILGICLVLMFALAVGALITMLRIFKTKQNTNKMADRPYIDIDEYREITEADKLYDTPSNDDIVDTHSYETEEDIYNAYKKGLIDERELAARLRGIYHDQDKR